MHDVEAHVARPRDAHHRVQVGAVVVEGAAHVVNHCGDLLDALVEEAERVRVGQHQARDVLVGLGAQVVDVDAAALVGGDLDDLVAGHRDGRGVGSMGGVRSQDPVARLAPVLVVGTGQQQPGQLTVRAGRGLQADVRQAADLRQRALQQPHQLEGPLGALRRLQRVQPRVARQRGDALVQLRVVLHRARAERVEARVEVEVAARDAVVVAHDLRLADLRQRRPAARSRCEGISSSSGRSGTSASGSCDARRPGDSSARRSSSPDRAASACRPGVDRRPRCWSRRAHAVTASPCGAGLAPTADRLEQRLRQPVDVLARATLGDRHQQAVGVLGVGGASG